MQIFVIASQLFLWTTAVEAKAKKDVLVDINFEDAIEIKDLARRYSFLLHKNIILDRNVTGKVQIISPQKVTIEEAHQAFLSALEMAGFSTLETGKVIKILKKKQAMRGNTLTRKNRWSSPSSEVLVTQLIPLKYIDAQEASKVVAKIADSGTFVVHKPTNTLIVTETSYKIRRILDILNIVDVKTKTFEVQFIPVKHRDVSKITTLIEQVLKTKKSVKKDQYLILQDISRNMIIYTGPESYLAIINKLLKELDVSDNTQVEIGIHHLPLEFSEAKKIASTINQLRTTFSKKKAASTKIVADDASNSIIVTGGLNTFKNISQIVSKLDYKRPQVFVEINILDINGEHGFKFSPSLLLGSGGKNQDTTRLIYGWQAQDMGSLAIAGSSGEVTSTTAQATSDAFSQDFTMGVLAGEGVQIPGIGKISPGALLKLIKADRYTKVISKPYLLTSDNEESSFDVGKTLYFRSSEPSDQGVLTEKVNKEKVTLSIRLTPKVSKTNNLTMKLELDRGM